MKNKFIFMVSLLIIICLFGNPGTTQAATEKDVTKSFKDTKKVTKLLKELNNWSGYQYIYLLKSKEKKTVKLTDNTILNVVALNYLEPNLGAYASATETGILARTNQLFGKKPNLDSLSTYEDEKASESMNTNSEFICKLKSGELATVIGDWGMYYPDMKIIKITKVKDKIYNVRVKTYFVDDETRKKDEFGITTFTIKKSAESEYGYIITGIRLQKTRE